MKKGGADKKKGGADKKKEVQITAGGELIGFRARSRIWDGHIDTLTH